MGHRFLGFELTFFAKEDVVEFGRLGSLNIKGGIAEAFRISFFQCDSRRANPGSFSSFSVVAFRWFLSRVSCNFSIVFMK